MMDDGGGGGGDSLALSPTHYFIPTSSFKLKHKRTLLQPFFRFDKSSERSINLPQAAQNSTGGVKF